jgi:hypothetical protein
MKPNCRGCAPSTSKKGANARKRFDAVLRPKEKMADFIREAMERELERREKKRPKE